MLELLAQTTPPDPNWTGVMSWVTPLAVAFVMVYGTHRYHLIRERRLRDREARHRLFGTLMGYNRLLSQLYFSKREAMIFAQYHLGGWRLAGKQKESLDLREGLHWMRAGEDIGLEIARAHPELCRAVAAAKVLFPSSPDLSILTDAVYNHGVPLREDADPNMDSAGLDEWKTEALAKLQQQVRVAIEVPINNLVEYLAPRVEKTTAAGAFLRRFLTRWRGRATGGEKNGRAD